MIYDFTGQLKCCDRVSYCNGLLLSNIQLDDPPGSFLSISLRGGIFCPLSSHYSSDERGHQVPFIGMKGAERRSQWSKGLGGHDLSSQNGMSGRVGATRISQQAKPSLQCHLLEVLKHLLEREEKLAAEDMEKNPTQRVLWIHKAPGEVNAAVNYRTVPLQGGPSLQVNLREIGRCNGEGLRRHP